MFGTFNLATVLATFPNIGWFFAQFFGHSVFNLIKFTKHICEQCYQLSADFGSRFILFAFLQWLNWATPWHLLLAGYCSSMPSSIGIVGSGTNGAAHFEHFWWKSTFLTFFREQIWYCFNWIFQITWLAPHIKYCF